MLQILNPFKAGNEFQKLKSRKKWILALALVLIPVILSQVGDSLIQQKNQELMQQFMEERGIPEEQPEGRGPGGPGPMFGIFRNVSRGGGPMGAQGNILTGLLLGIAFVVLFWVLKSSVFHVMSKILGGEHVSISSTIHLIAYTYIPFVFKGILDIVEGITYNAPTAAEGLMFQSRNTDMLLNFIRGNLNIFVVWSLFLMIIAVRELYIFGNKKAALVVLLTYGAVWVIQIALMSSGGLFGLFGGM